MNRFIFTAMLMLLAGTLYAQRLMERSGQATFYSEAPVENITATNEQVLAVADTENGEVAVTMLMKGFQFRKALMQQHFNEDYVESDKFPKASFAGRIKDYDPEIWKTGGTITVEGELSIHGITRPLTTEVNIAPDAEFVRAETSFKVRVADHAIEIPSIVVDNIAEVVDVTVKLELKPQ